MITREALVKDRDLCNDKAIGCLSGLAIGDTMGELARGESYRVRYGVILNLYGDSHSTDDTEFALLTAKIVIASGGNVAADVVHSAWMEYVVEGGINQKTGMVSRGAMENLRRGIKPPLSGQDNWNFYDDGAAMRVAPIGIVCAGRPEDAAAMARIDAEISHYSDGIWGAQAVAASLAVAMVDGTIDEIVEAGIAQIPESSWLGRYMATAMRICDEEKTLKNSWERLHDELWTGSHSCCPEAISQTYALLRLTADQGFEDSVAAASNFGRDADTLGAIVGAVVGAKFGARAIPPDWIEKTRKPRGIALSFAANEDVVTTALELANLIR